MSRSIVAVGVALLGLALVACGDEGSDEGTTSIDKTDPTSEYRVATEAPYESRTLDRLPAPSGSVLVHEVSRSGVRPLPGREAALVSGEEPTR